MIQIAQATYSGNFTIDFVFTDGHRNKVDFGPFLMASPNEMTKPFRELTAFQAFQIGSNRASVVWGQDQAMSFDISSIYDRNPTFTPINPMVAARYLAYLDHA